MKAARLACPESKDEMHFLLLPLLVPMAESDPADQCVGRGMSVRTERFCDWKTMRIVVDAAEMFTKTFPQCARSKRQLLNFKFNTWNRGVTHNERSTDKGHSPETSGHSLTFWHFINFHHFYLL